MVEMRAFISWFSFFFLCISAILLAAFSLSSLAVRGGKGL